MLFLNAKQQKIFKLKYFLLHFNHTNTIISVAFCSYNAMLFAKKNIIYFSPVKCTSDVMKNPTSSSFKQKYMNKPLLTFNVDLFISFFSNCNLKQPGWLFPKKSVFTYFNCFYFVF